VGTKYQHRVEGLEPGKAYQITMRALDDKGNLGPATEAISAVTAGEPTIEIISTPPIYARADTTWKYTVDTADGGGLGQVVLAVAPLGASVNEATIAWMTK
jgi:hypothetical protein